MTAKPQYLVHIERKYQIFIGNVTKRLFFFVDIAKVARLDKRGVGG